MSDQLGDTTFNLLTNALMSRSSLIALMGDAACQQDRIESDCGYPIELGIENFRKAFRRGDIAKRIIQIWPEGCWRNKPDIFETEDPIETPFEKEWKKLVTKQAMYSQIKRADILSGIGQFGVILLGLSDGKPLTEIAPGLNERGEKVGGVKGLVRATRSMISSEPTTKLNYMRILDESFVQINRYETDENNPRFGFPTQYTLSFQDSNRGMMILPQGGPNLKTLTVHWSRIIHLADNRADSDVFGMPRLEVVYNKLIDMLKIGGGSAEMFYKGGFPGLALEALPQVLDGVIKFDLTATKEQMAEYYAGLKRFIQVIGMQVKSLAPNIASPKDQFEVTMRLIATAIGIPWRIFIGAEVGQLASEQDQKEYNDKLNMRREDYVSPFMLRPMIDRLMDVGVLPEPRDREYTIEWKDLNTPSEKENAEVAAKITAAMTQYISSGLSQLMRPFHYLTVVCKFSDEQVRSFLESADVGEDDEIDIPMLEPEPEEEPSKSENKQL